MRDVVVTPVHDLGPGWTVAAPDGSRFALYLPSRGGTSIEWLPGRWTQRIERTGYWAHWNAPSMVAGAHLLADTLEDALATFTPRPHGPRTVVVLTAVVDTWLARHRPTLDACGNVA